MAMDITDKIYLTVVKGHLMQIHFPGHRPGYLEEESSNSYEPDEKQHWLYNFNSCSKMVPKPQ
ncbi:hypothetical protein CS542_03765 [Pedobacter sp. IW39]|nr:hypothetical protein CS542_03765 [Pedobacter sp. IW39]